MTTDVPKTVLLVEDDRVLASLLAEILTQEGFAVRRSYSGSDALEALRNQAFDMVVLDLMLPGRSGFEVCKQGRDFFDGPILILTARDSDRDELRGFELGADDYVTKPVRPEVLLARMRALMRRISPALSGDLHIGPLRIQRSPPRVEVANKAIELTPSEYSLLVYLADRAGQIVQREELYRALKGTDYDRADRSLDLRVSKIRRRIRDAAAGLDIIETVHGHGYRINDAR